MILLQNKKTVTKLTWHCYARFREEASEAAFAFINYKVNFIFKSSIGVILTPISSLTYAKLSLNVLIM
jgi:alpha-D-ribose 1-methylphosphonate 5-triphosphate synthase subunit PhnH